MDYRWNCNVPKADKKIVLSATLLENDLKTRMQPKFMYVQNMNKDIRKYGVGSLKKSYEDDSFKKIEKIDKDEFETTINNAMSLQQVLYETAELINNGSQLQLLFIVLEAFVAITFNCYYLASVNFMPLRFKLNKTDAILFLLQHLFQPCVNILSIVVGFQLIQNSFRYTQNVVNKLIIQNKDPQLGNRLLQFSQQIVTNTPKFSVFGLFPLDGSLISSIAAATTTYLIILLQQSNNKQPDPAHTNGSN